MLLALKDLQEPLDESQQEALSSVAEQLSLDPEAWESDIEPDLLAAIEEHPPLQQLFQAAKSRLDAKGDNIPVDLLPTVAEIEAAVPSEAGVASRGFAPVGDVSDFESNEINNMAISILAAPNPSASAKQVSGFDKLKNFLAQS